MPGGRRLYAVLGVEPSATPAEIKKAYRTKALTCHPDKVGPQGEAEFKKINEAYGVLSDAQKKKVYDDYGEKGLEYMNNGVADPLMATLGSAAVILFAATFAFFTCFCALAALACVASKADGHHPSWSWGTTLWGLWLWEAAVLIPLGLAIWSLIKNFVRGPSSQWSQEEDKRPPRMESLRQLAVLLWALLYFVFTVVLAATLDRQRDGKHHLKWMQVAAPLLVAELARTVYEVVTINPAPWLREQELHEFGLLDLAALFLGRAWGAIYRPLTILLVALRADGSIESKWGGVLVPAMLHLIFTLITAAVVNRLRVRNGLMDGGDLCKQTAADAFNTLLLLTTLGLLGAKLQGTASYSYGVALIPVFIQLSYLTLVSCVLFAVAGAMSAAQADEADDADDSDAPDGDYSRLDSNAATPANRKSGGRGAHDVESHASPVSTSANSAGYGGIDASLD